MSVPVPSFVKAPAPEITPFAVKVVPTAVVIVSLPAARTMGPAKMLLPARLLSVAPLLSVTGSAVA